MKQDQQLLAKVAQAVSKTCPEEIDCEDCFAEMDRLAERMLAGSATAADLEYVQDHLAHCKCCLEEYEALIAALRATT